MAKANLDGLTDRQKARYDYLVKQGKQKQADQELTKWRKATPETPSGGGGSEDKPPPITEGQGAALGSTYSENAIDTAEGLYNTLVGEGGKFSEQAKAAFAPISLSPEQLAAERAQLDRFSGLQDTAGQISPEMRGVLDTYKQRLAGYDAPEFQAMREQAAANIDASYRNQMAQSARTQARSGVRGASAAAQQNQLGQARIGQQQQLEQGLFVKGAEEKRRALDAYNQALGTEEQSVWTRGREARTDYTNLMNQYNNRNLDVTKYNSQQAQGQLGYGTGIWMGGLSAATGRRSEEESNEILKNYINKFSK